MTKKTITQEDINFLVLTIKDTLDFLEIHGKITEEEFILLCAFNKKLTGA